MGRGQRVGITLTFSMPARYIDEPHGIVTIDAQYIQPGIASLQLIIEDDHAAFIDTGTAHSLSHARQVLQHKGLNDTDVDFVIPTHVHLDHAGGAGVMMQAFTNATLIIHPRGAQHMADPAKLWSGTVSVYGEKMARQLYGEVIPVNEDRMLIADDGYEVDFRGRALRFLDTPGHARHHFCIHDIQHRVIFAGDTMGISYRKFDGPNGPFVFPTTSPVQFDPEALHQSIDRLMDIDPKSVFVTHFGRIECTHKIAQSLHQQINDFVNMAETLTQTKDIKPVLERHISEYLLDRARQHDVPLSDTEIQAGLQMDARLNADGIAVWLSRSKKQAP